MPAHWPFSAIVLAATLLAAPIFANAKTYLETVGVGLKTRSELSAAYETASTRADRDAVVKRAREAVMEQVTAQLIPAWFGTKWDFNGISQKPGSGEIACGYFVSTILRDAGFKVQRIKLAQQASEKIITTLTSADRVQRFRTGGRTAVLAQVRKSGDGLYVVGLDFHVGFIVKDGDTLDFCHSSYVDPPLSVVCNPAADDPAMASQYYVLGQLLGPRMMAAWLTDKAILVR